MKKQDLQYSWF